VDRLPPSRRARGSSPRYSGGRLIVAACLVLAGQAGYRLLESVLEGLSSWGYVRFALAALGLAVWVVLARRAPASCATGSLAALALFLSGEGVSTAT